MSDDKTKTGKADRDRVAEDENYEVQVLADKFGRTPDQVRAAIRGAGPMRKDIEAALAK